MTPPEFTLALAGREDDAAISALLAQSDLPGWIRLSYRVTPGAHGMPHPRARSQTLLARGSEGLAGMVTRSTFPAWMGGSETRLSYLGHFRVAPAARRRVKLLRRAFEDCQKRFGTDPLWSFASLLDGNTPALRLLTSGLPGFPRFTTIGRYQSLVMRSLGRADDPSIRLATPADMPEVAAFYRANRRPLAPVLEADDISSGRWPGLAPHDFLLAERSGRLTGVIALWDQRPFRQLKVTGYQRPLSHLRWAVNALGPLTGFPYLPRVGEDLALAYLSFLTVEAGDTATALRLIRAARTLAGARGLRSVALGLADGDPLVLQLRKGHGAAAYGSCIYTVTWQDGAAPPPDAFVGMQPEIGLL
jgi:hypothetical protein